MREALELVYNSAKQNKIKCVCMPTLRLCQIPIQYLQVPKIHRAWLHSVCCVHGCPSYGFWRANTSFCEIERTR